MLKTKQAKSNQQAAFADPRVQVRVIPKPRKERPASKARVHKGRTRD